VSPHPISSRRRSLRAAAPRGRVASLLTLRATPQAGLLALTLLGGALGSGCGGKAIVDAPWLTGGGGTGGTGGTTITSTTSSTTTTTGGFGGTGGQGGVGGEPGDYQLVEVAFGQVPKDSSVTFEITPQTLGVTMIVYSFSPMGGVGVKSLTAPNQELLINNHKIPGHHYEFSWYGTTVSGLPQSDSSTVMPVVMPGTWTMTVGDPNTNAGADHVSVWRRESEDGLFHGGYLDLNVFIAGGIVGEAYATNLFESAFDGYAGLQIGEIVFHDIGAQFQVIDENNWLPALQQTASGSQAPALNVIMVGWFEGQLQDAAGIAAGIPGQGIEHGTNSSAVTMMSYGDINMDSLIVRHEAGHLSGLFHTSEIAIGQHDPLADTPECSNVEQLLDGCPDAFNLMFPYALYGIDITPLQDRVIQGGSLYRAELVYAGDPELGKEPPSAPAPASQASQAASAGLAVDVAKLKPTGGWTKGLDPRLTHLLSSHWCADEWLRTGVMPHRQRLARLVADTGQLWAIGLAADAPSHVRYRALIAAADRAAKGASHTTASRSAPTAALLRLARNRSASRGARLGALLALERVAPTRAAGLTAELRGDTDAAVSAWARR